MTNEPYVIVREAMCTSYKNSAYKAEIAHIKAMHMQNAYDVYIYIYTYMLNMLVCVFVRVKHNSVKSNLCNRVKTRLLIPTQ